MRTVAGAILLPSSYLHPLPALWYAICGCGQILPLKMKRISSDISHRRKLTTSLPTGANYPLFLNGRSGSIDAVRRRIA